MVEVGKEIKIVPRLSVLGAIEFALNRHKSLYNEHPGMVLVGPSELQVLLLEMSQRCIIGAAAPNAPLAIYGMTVIPKCSDGIDFSASCLTSQRVMFNRHRERTLGN